MIRKHAMHTVVPPRTEKGAERSIDRAPGKQTTSASHGMAPQRMAWRRRYTLSWPRQYDTARACRVVSLAARRAQSFSARSSVSLSFFTYCIKKSARARTPGVGGTGGKWWGRRRRLAQMNSPKEEKRKENVTAVLGKTTWSNLDVEQGTHTDMRTGRQQPNGTLPRNGQAGILICYHKHHGVVRAHGGNSLSPTVSRA